jgi:N,N-dimethylformamidase beta subunit-like protein
VNESPHGYLDRWTARPGETLALKASSALAYRVEVVRVQQGDVSEAGPGRREEPQDWWPARVFPARPQPVRPGSLAISAPLPALRLARWAELELLLRPSLVPAPGGQVVAALLDGAGEPVIALALTGDGRPELRAGTGERRTCARDGSGALLAGRWYRATLRLDLAAGSAQARITSVHAHPGGPQELAVTIAVDAGPAPERLVLAALSETAADREHFNGKLEEPVLRGSGEAGGFCYRWQLGPQAGAAEVAELGGEPAGLRLVNMPMAGVTGHNWDGTVLTFSASPQQYRALAFHEDDLSDAGWATTLTLTLPDQLRSGVYAITLTSAAGQRYVPFFVAPAPAGRSRPPIAVLLPTFTYLAYANEHVREGLDHFDGVRSWPSRQDEEISAHRDFGLSLYDHHADGSGVCYSSPARPVLNLDPSYRFWLFNGPVHLGEDLYLLDWLSRLGYDYDVITDHLLDAEGSGLLAGYRVVLTGSHPEYASLAMLDALEAHVQRGGRLMYLGGNGFYWVTSASQDGLIEIRRGNSGGRAWESEPGECYHSTTAEPGGLWRHRGRPPNRLFGVGFAAQGADESAPGYRRVLAAELAGEWGFVFDGLSDPAAIGDSGLLLGGAAGNEVDRADASRGSPVETVVLATSKGHSDAYQLAHEDLPFTAPGQGGTEQALVRSDVVVVPYAGGGIVFSVGSITWLGSLAFNGYDNDVARLTHNVLKRFLAERSVAERSVAAG